MLPASKVEEGSPSQGTWAGGEEETSLPWSHQEGRAWQAPWSSVLRDFRPPEPQGDRCVVFTTRRGDVSHTAAAEN